MKKNNLTPQEKTFLEKAKRNDINGWIYLHIEGDGYERGFQHGYLLANEIKGALQVIRYLIHYDTGSTFEFFMQNAMKMFPKHIDQEFMDEMQGIADGSTKAGYKVSADEILAWNAYPELICNWWPPAGGAGAQPQHLKHRPHKCSAFVATGKATRGGKVVMAHTTWQLYGASDWYNVVLDIHPKKGNRMIMQSVPGYIDSSTDFWIASSGLMICETSIVGFSGFDATKSPEFFRSRKATQYAKSINEWRNIMLDNNNGGYANIWLLGNHKTGEIARFELGLKYYGFEKKKDGCYAGYNAPENIELRNFECSNTGYGDIRNNGARQVRWMELFKKYHGKIDAKLAKEMIADHHDVYTGKENPCGRTICGHFEHDNGSTGGSTPPYFPWGSADGKIADSKMAQNMSFEGIWGHACGAEFNADKFIDKNPQYNWLKGYMKNRPSQPWTPFKSLNKKS
ncbi:MAG: phospholipase [Bacteroidetes bacterium]|nr:phospholipase [Bacteroidota bacterium]